MTALDDWLVIVMQGSRFNVQPLHLCVGTSFLKQQSIQFIGKLLRDELVHGS